MSWLKRQKFKWTRFWLRFRMCWTFGLPFWSVFQNKETNESLQIKVMDRHLEMSQKHFNENVIPYLYQTLEKDRPELSVKLDDETIEKLDQYESLLKPFGMTFSNLNESVNNNLSGGSGDWRKEDSE